MICEIAHAGVSQNHDNMVPAGEPCNSSPTWHLGPLLRVTPWVPIIGIQGNPRELRV